LVSVFAGREYALKVKVLKEMPLAKVGEVLHMEEIGNKLRHYHKTRNNCAYLEWFRDDFKIMMAGWLEEVKEESLYEKFYHSDLDSKWGSEAWVKYMAQIAKEHYLEVFDRAKKDWLGNYKESPLTDVSTYNTAIPFIRKALEGGK